MAYAATVVAVMAIPLLVLFGLVRLITREIPDDREREIEVKFGPASIRLRVGPKPPEKTGLLLPQGRRPEGQGTCRR